MDHSKLEAAVRALGIALAALLVVGCESTNTLSKKIDYKSASSAPQNGTGPMAGNSSTRTPLNGPDIAGLPG